MRVIHADNVVGESIQLMMTVVTTVHASIMYIYCYMSQFDCLIAVVHFKQLLHKLICKSFLVSI